MLYVAVPVRHPAIAFVRVALPLTDVRQQLRAVLDGDARRRSAWRSSAPRRIAWVVVRADRAARARRSPTSRGATAAAI